MRSIHGRYALRVRVRELFAQLLSAQSTTTRAFQVHVKVGQLCHGQLSMGARVLQVSSISHIRYHSGAKTTQRPNLGT